MSILDTLNLQPLFGHLYPWTGSSETWNLKMLSGAFRSVELIMDCPDLSPFRNISGTQFPGISEKPKTKEDKPIETAEPINQTSKVIPVKPEELQLDFEPQNDSFENQM